MLAIAKKGKSLLLTSKFRVFLALIVLGLVIVAQLKKTSSVVPLVKVDWEKELPRLADERVDGNLVTPFYFGEEVANLVYKGHVLPIYWSFSKTQEVTLCFDEASGYPGFGQPMMVTGNPASLPDLDLMECGESSFLVFTEYGNFEYEVQDIFVCTKKGDQWVRVDGQKPLVKEGQEVLYVLCEQENGFVTLECRKIDGTTLEIGGTYGSDF